MNKFDHYYFSNNINALPAGDIDQIGWLISQRLLRGLDKRQQVIVTRNVSDAKKLHSIISTHSPQTISVLFADYETLPYDQLSPNPNIILARQNAIQAIINEPTCVTIVAIQTLLHLIPPKSFLSGQIWDMSVGMILPRDKLISRLIACGYQQCTQVSSVGEFAVRGGMIDVFMLQSEMPIRIEYFDDTIDSMYFFDIDTQISVKKINTYSCSNLRDIPWPLSKKLISDNFQLKTSYALSTAMTKQLLKTSPPNGYQYALPIYHDEVGSLLDCMQKDCLISVIGDIKKESENYFELLNRRFSENSLTSLHPNKITMDFDSLLDQIDSHTTRAQGTDTVFGVLDNDTLVNQLKIHPTYKSIVYSATPARNKILFRQLSAKFDDASLVEEAKSIQHLTHKISILPGEPLNDFTIPSWQTIISGAAVSKVKERSKKNSKNSLTSLDVTHLIKDQLVIHESYGLGKFIKVSTELINNQPHELIQLEYASDCEVSVSMDQIHQLTIYQGPMKALDQPGHKKWQTKLKKAKENIEKVALEMAQHQSQRKHAQALKCDKSEEYNTFCSQFLFEPTESQQDCFTAVEEDMLSTKPMERLICGDVGFGKTEIAMRAACLAVMNGGQVVILAPTTILAQQHYNNLIERFIHQPVKIDYLSRKTTAKQKTSVIESINEGKTDILVATHLGTNQKIIMKKLGLLIIDEEHKFGVNVKQHWLNTHPGAHRLMLSATPIPRTLNQALSNLYDINLMATPPKGRQNIKISVREYDVDLMSEAVLRETNRGGQVYCVVNKIKDIAKYKQDIEIQFPELRVVSAHGQMPSNQLEKIMYDFQRCHYDVMVCTSIIESGIDIANANTIMIMNADHFGLAQLHQLRGRVGRSHQQAYACMFIYDRQLSTHHAIARLDAMLRHDQIGSGASLAMEDLEIRGAGHILGKDQSGHVDAIGLSLYAKLIDASYNSAAKFKSMAAVNISIDAFVCDKFITDKLARIQLYQSIYQAESVENVNEIEIELTLKYGRLNFALSNLLDLQRIKLFAQQANIEKISGKSDEVEIAFGDKAAIDHNRLISLVTGPDSKIMLQSENTIKVKIEDNHVGQVTELLESIIN